jgi:ribosomal protein S4
MSEARRLIMQAQVKVNGKTVENPFAEIDETAIVTVGKEVPGA